MKADSEQYRQVIKEQEIKANRNILVGFRYILAALIAVWFMTMLNIFALEKNLVTLTVAFHIPMFLLPSYLGEKFGLSRPWLKYAFLTIVCVACSSLAAVLTYHLTLIYILPLLFAVQCRQRSALWYTFCVNVVSMAVSSVAGYYYGLCDLNLLLEGNYTRSWYLENMKDGLVSLPLNQNIIVLILVLEVLPRVMMLLIFALMLQYIVVRSGEDAVRIAELIWQKETDITTGVYNKNKYEEMADAYYPRIDRIAAIYWDLNDLKKTNDTMGHAMGDALIATLSKGLMEEGDERYRVYRLGGDEFLLIIDDPKRYETEGAIKSIRARLQRLHEEGAPKVSSAVGWSAGDGKKVRVVVRTADANMYANKVAGKEGRGR